MQEIDDNLRSEYDLIRSKTVYEIYIMYFIVSFIVAVPSIIFSLRDFQSKLITFLIFMIITTASFLVVFFFRKLIKNVKMHLWFYLFVAIVITIFLAFSSADKYMTTLGVATLSFTVIIFHTLSKKLLVIQALLTFSIFLFFGILAVGKNVELGTGYVFSMTGNYILIVLVFFKGIKMFEKFEELYFEQLKDLNEMNLELRAVNEEYLATEEELVSKYEEVERLNRDMYKLNRFLTSIIDVTEDGYLTYNLNTYEMKLYNGLDKTLGISEYSVEKQISEILTFISDEGKERFNRTWEKIYNGEKKFEEIDLHYNNGIREMDLVFTLLYLQEDNEKSLIITVKDITNRKDNERDIIYRLEHDRLTGALNLSGFINALGKRLTLLKDNDFFMVLFDLDNFKYINNSFGHEIGDRVLIEIVAKLSSEEYGFKNVARAEGDTILFIVPKTFSYPQVMRILKYVLNTIIIEDVDFRINASVGMAEAYEGITPLEMVRNAEMAMFKVKESGKGSFAAHDDEYLKQMERKYKIFRVINKAIEDNEFYLLYQPIISLETYTIKGFEALARWDSPEMGHVSPNEFIDMAEKTGQIIELGYYIMKKAMKFAKAATEINDELIISINISPRQLLDDSFISNTITLINETEVKPENIAFEITENAYIENLIQVKALLEVIKQIGINIYLDDFGTGYSSLNYLNRLPIQVLKIDKSFVDTIHKSSQAKELLSSITLLSRSLGYRSIAEGVEDIQEIDILKECGCDCVQGYYFDRPLDKNMALDKINNKYIL